MAKKRRGLNTKIKVRVQPGRSQLLKYNFVACVGTKFSS